MAKKINLADLVFKVSDDGTLKVFAGGAKKAGKELKNVEKQQDKTTYATKKGINATANGTKNFANMARGISGSLVPAYATLAANVFALTAVFGFLKEAADYRLLKEGQAAYAGVTGVAYKSLTNAIVDATDAQIRYNDAAQAAAIGTAAGLTPDQLEKLGAAAKTVSIALGRDVTDSFNRLIRGTTKAEPELLDELGIILRLDTATRAYADALGVSKESLNAFQRTQAVTADVLTQVETKFNAINAIMDPQTNKINKLAKSFDDLMNTLRDFVAGPAEGLASFFANNLRAAIGALGLFVLPIIQQILPAFDEMAANAEKNMKQHNAALDSARAKVVEYEISQKKAALAASTTYNSQLKNLQQMSAGVAPGVAGTGLQALQQGKDISQGQLRALKAQATRQVGVFKNMTKQMRDNWIMTMNQMSTTQKTSFTEKSIAEFKRVELSAKAGFARMKVAYQATIGFMQRITTGFAKFASKAFGIFSAISIGLLVFEGLKAGAQKFGFFGGEADKAAESIENLVQRQRELNKELDKMFEDRATLQEMGAPFRNMVKQAGNLFTSANFGADAQSLQKIRDERAGLSVRAGFDTANVRGRKYHEGDTSRSFSGKMTGGGSITNLTADEIRYAFLQKEEEKYRKAVGTTLSKFKNEFPTVMKAVNKEGLFTGDFDKDGNLKINNEVGDLISLITKGSAGVEMLDQGANKFSQSINANFGKASSKVLFYRDALVRANAQQDVLNAMIAANEEQPGRYSEDDIATQRGAVKKAKTFSTGIKSSVDAQRLLVTETARLGVLKESLKQRIYAGTILGQQQQVRVQILEKEAQITQLMDEIAYRTANVTKGDEETNRQEIADMVAKKDLLEQQKGGLSDSINLTKQLGVEASKAFGDSMQKGIQGVIEGTMSMKDAFKGMAKSILTSLAQVLAKMMTMRILSSAFGIPMASGGVIPMARGGIKGYASGGIAREPTYLVGEAGPEAVVPLPDGRKIPVDLGGNGGTNNVTINVDASGSTSSTGDGEQGKALGMAIQAAVMETIQREQRPGGVLGGG